MERRLVGKHRWYKSDINWYTLYSYTETRISMLIYRFILEKLRQERVHRNCLLLSRLVCVLPILQAPSLTGSLTHWKLVRPSVPFLRLLCSRHSSSLGNASHGFSIRRNSQTHVSKLSRGGPVLEISCAVFLKCWCSQSYKIIRVRCFVRCTCEDGGLLDVQREASCQASTWLWHDLCRLYWVQGLWVHLLHLMGGSWMFIISWVHYARFVALLHHRAVMTSVLCIWQARFCVKCEGTWFEDHSCLRWKKRRELFKDMEWFCRKLSTQNR